jgi:CPA1 family monovalent cation:H+ antiporter
VIAVALGVIVVTLMFQGLTLRPLIKRLAIPHDDVVETEERRARVEATHAALARLDVLAKHNAVPRDVVRYVRTNLEQRTRLDLDDIEHNGHHDRRTTEDLVIALEHDIRGVARQAVVQLRDDGVIGQEALRRVQNDLDLDEIRSAAWLGGRNDERPASS